MKLTDRELATVLAALRYWQDNTHYCERDAMPHFEEEEPLTDEEINDLCEEINCAED